MGGAKVSIRRVKILGFIDVTKEGDHIRKRGVSFESRGLFFLLRVLF